MQQQSYSLVIEAPRQGLHDITAEIADWLTGQPVRSGLLTVFIRHSSASLLIQENWDDDVVADSAERGHPMLQCLLCCRCVRRRRPRASGAASAAPA